MKMTRTMGWIGLVLAAAIGMSTLTACKQEGPAEKAGKALDQAADNMKQSAEEAKKEAEGALKE